MKIGLMNCDPGRGFETMFANWLSADWKIYDIQQGQHPQDLNECDAYVTSGSKASVYEDVPWIHQFAELIRQLHAANKPTLGVCFGHQMMGHALGGRTAKSSNGWGIGVHNFQIRQTQSWMQPEAAEISVLMSCQDQVIDLPPGAEVLAGNEHCPIGLFQIGSMLGIQGHPEFTPAYAEAALNLRRDRIGPGEVDAALATLNQPLSNTLLAHWALAFFG